MSTITQKLETQGVSQIYSMCNMNDNVRLDV